MHAYHPPKHHNFYGVRKYPAQRSVFHGILWAFQNLPLTSPVLLIISVIFVGISFATQLGMGITLIVFGSIGTLYILIRYTLIAYRLFSKNTPVKNSVFVVFDLKFAEYISIGAIIMGLYLIDDSPGRSRYFLHAGFNAGYNLYGVWLYVIAATISVMTGTGYSSIVENDLPCAVVFSFGIALSYYSTLIILGNLAAHWYDYYAELPSVTPTSK